MMSKRTAVLSYEFAPFPGGHGTYATEMARALCRKGWRVDVLAPAYPSAQDAEEPFRTERKLVHQRITPSGLLASILFVLRRPGQTILACDIRAALCALCVSWLVGGRVVAMFHGSEILKARDSKTARLINSLVAKLASARVANSAYTAALVTEYTNKPCAVALLGVGDYWLEPAEGPFSDPVLSTLPPEATLLCTVARLEPRKGHLDALAAIEAMDPAVAETLVYVIAGKPIDQAYTRALLEKAAASPAMVRHVGVLTRDDVRRLFARSLAQILPARAEPDTIEGFGLATIEAAGQGCPSIVTRVGGLPEAVLDQQTGFHCGDVGQIAFAISTLQANAAMRNRMSNAARTHARNSTWEATVSQTPLLNG